MLLGVIGWSDRVTQRQVGEGESGHGDLVDDVASRTNDERGDTVCFEVACGQTDRLMADRSKWDEHDEVDLIFDKPLANLLGPLGCSPMAVDGADSSEPWGDRANDTFVLERLEVVEWQERTEVVRMGRILVPEQVLRRH